MVHELDYFRIGDSYGFNQDIFPDLTIRLGGCAAITACESCIFMDLYQGTQNLYPFDKSRISSADYIRFVRMMKPYLRPRMSGIDRLEIYTEGLDRYLSDRGNTQLTMSHFSGEETAQDAREVIRRQIDRGFLIPCLLLLHQNKLLEDYSWHWFLLTGYEAYAGKFLVKVVSYGTWCWIDLDFLWQTGHTRKGGLVLFDKKDL